MSLKSRVAIFFLLLVSFGAGFGLMRQMQVHQTVYDICDLIEEKFYLDDGELENWVDRCRASALQLSLFSSRAQIMRTLQDLMDQMHVSHFMIYSPIEDQKLWTGQAVETGVKARWMEDHAIIYQITPNSPGEKAGLRLGDEVISISGDEMDDPEDVSSRGGIYQILRGDKNLKLQVTPGVVQLDSKPSLQKLDDHTALVTLSSFRSEYFDDAAWKKFVTEWKPYSKLIVDLRENAGGNLVSMLRALSPLFCRPSVIGDLSLPRKTEGEKEVLVNDLSDDQQIDEMDSSSGIILKTFEGYGCYRGSVAVLIGPHTSSVSEIFAAAMMHRPNTRVMGQPTSGDVVLAVWYDLPTWGRGYSISIPEALYLTREGKPLEGRGVFPQQEVFDDLKVWRQGRDSWIQAARAARF